MANFVIDLSRLVNLSKKQMDTVVRKLVIDVGSRVVMRSPVDTGRFRANWQYDFGKIPTGSTENVDQAGINSISSLVYSIGKPDSIAGFHYFANNLPYADRLEHGWSSQAPQGMVGLTMLEFSGKKL